MAKTDGKRAHHSARQNHLSVGFPVVRSGDVEVLRVSVDWPSAQPGQQTAPRRPYIDCHAHLSDDAKEQVETAVHAAVSIFWPNSVHYPTKVRIHAEEHITSLDGCSMGLAVALATIANHPSKAKQRLSLSRIAASGRVDDEGKVLPVEYLALKEAKLGPEWTRVLFPDAEESNLPIGADRVVWVNHIRTAWKNAFTPCALADIQRKEWTKLDRTLPPQVPAEKRWLMLPSAVDDWNAYRLRNAEQRVVLVHGPPRSGRSRVLRHLAHELRQYQDEDRSTAGNDVLVWIKDAKFSFRKITSDEEASDAELLQVGPMQRAGIIWLFAENLEDEEFIQKTLELDPRIRVLVTASRWFVKAFETPHISIQVHAYGHPDDSDSEFATSQSRLTPLAQQHIRALTPWSRALVLHDVRYLDFHRRSVSIALPFNKHNIWMHEVLADELQAWSATGILAAELATICQNELLCPLESSDSRFYFEQTDPIIYPWQVEAAAKFSAEADHVPDAGWEWSDHDEDEALIFEPLEEQIPALLARAFLTSPSWRRCKNVPDSDVWLRVRDHALRPVLSEVVAQTACELLDDPASVAQTMPRLVDTVWAALDDRPSSAEVESDPESILLEVDAWLITDLLIRAAWRALDARPLAGKSLLHYSLLRLQSEEPDPDQFVGRIIRALAEVLYAPSGARVLLPCGDSVIQFLNSVHRTLRKLKCSSLDQQAVAKRFLPLRALLAGDPQPACDRYDERFEHMGDLAQESFDLIEWNKCMPLYDHSDVYGLCWSSWLVPSERSRVNEAMGVLYNHIWNHRMRVFEHPHTVQLCTDPTSKEYKILKKRIERYWFELRIGRHLPWVRPTGALRVQQLDSIVTRLGISVSLNHELPAYQNAFDIHCHYHELERFPELHWSEE